MLRVGLTGGLGSGKTTAALIFETLGIPVYSADGAAKRVMMENDKLRHAIVENFGIESYRDGALNRSFVAEKVFNDAEKLRLLNSLVHPVTIADAEQWMARQTSSYAIKEAALIFESDAHLHLDVVIGVSAPESLRIQRAMLRDQLTGDEVRKRLARQMNEEEKMKRCDYVLLNDETSLLLPQVIALHETLLSKAKEIKGINS